MIAGRSPNYDGAVYLRLTSDHDDCRNAGEEVLDPRCEHGPDVPPDGTGERHALSPCIEYERRLESTEWCGIERALPARATDLTEKAITALPRRISR